MSGTEVLILLILTKLMEDQIPNLLPTRSLIRCLVWNVQGAEKREFKVTLKEILRINKTAVVTILETHQDAECAE